MLECKVINDAIKTFGKEKQSIVAMEECAELIKEISKMLRGKGDREHLIEEIADVSIMIAQLQAMYFISYDEIKEVKDGKYRRLLERIENR